VLFGRLAFLLEGLFFPFFPFRARARALVHFTGVRMDLLLFFFAGGRERERSGPVLVSPCWTVLFCACRSFFFLFAFLCGERAVVCVWYAPPFKISSSFMIC
jgi:hypothetical protein